MVGRGQLVLDGGARGCRVSSKGGCWKSRSISRDEFINSRAKTLPRFVSLNGFVSLLLTQMRGRGFGLESDLVRFSSVIVLLARDFGRKIYSRDLFLTRRACYVASKVIPFRGKSRR